MSRRVVLAAGVAAVAVGVVLALVLHGSGTRTFTGPPGNAFRLAYPPSWRVDARVPHGTLAALVGPNGKSSLTIARDLPARRLDGARLRTQVTADFNERLEDYRLLSASMERTGAGGIFVYSYLPPAGRRVHTVALVPAGDHSYVLTGIALGAAVRQVDAIIRSFRPA